MITKSHMGRVVRRFVAASVSTTAAVVAVSTLAAGAAGATLPTLTGENFQSQPLAGGTMQVTATCGADNSGTVTYQAAGPATGPFAGTFAESGRLEIGTADPPGSLESPITQWRASFEVSSSSGSVVGTAAVDGSQTTATCQNPSPQFPFPKSASGIVYSGSYSAIIHPAGSKRCYLDSGTTTWAFTSVTDSSMAQSFTSTGSKPHGCPRSVRQTA